jgi:hypothetical protein
MTIPKIHLINLRNEEHYQFQTDFKGLVDHYTPAALGIEVAYAVYLALYGDEGTALDMIRKSAVTEKITEADLLRDITFRGLRDAVKAAGNHFNPSVKEAAARLQVAFDHYGNLTLKPYDEETAAIAALITDLRTTYASDAALTGISDWINELQANNTAFDTLKKERYTEEAGKTQLRMKEVRTEIDATFRTITDRINALIIVNGEAVYAEFVNELNQRIENYNLVIAQRQGRNAKANESNDGGGGETEPKSN